MELSDDKNILYGLHIFYQLHIGTFLISYRLMLQFNEKKCK